MIRSGPIVPKQPVVVVRFRPLVPLKIVGYLASALSNWPVIDAATSQASRSGHRSRGPSARGEAMRGHGSAARARDWQSPSLRMAGRQDPSSAGAPLHSAPAECPHLPPAHRKQSGRRLRRSSIAPKIREQSRERTRRASDGCRATGIAWTSRLPRGALRRDWKTRASQGRRWYRSPDPASAIAQRP